MGWTHDVPAGRDIVGLFYRGDMFIYGVDLTLLWGLFGFSLLNDRYEIDVAKYLKNGLALPASLSYTTNFLLDYLPTRIRGLRIRDLVGRMKMNAISRSRTCTVAAIADPQK